VKVISFRSKCICNLGNIRATVRDEKIEGLATFEPSRETEERAAFGNYEDTEANLLPNSIIYDHTAEGYPGDSTNYTSVRLTGRSGEIMGLTWGHQVAAGAVLNSEVYVKYNQVATDAASTNIVDAFAGAFTTAYGISGTGESAELYNYLTNDLFAAGPLFSGEANQELPKAYLNYLFFDQDMIFRPEYSGFKQVSLLALEDGSCGGTDGCSHEQLSFSLTAQEDGYYYVYFSNESEKVWEVFFDDFNVTLDQKYVSETTDFYPFGLVMRQSRFNTQESYRFGYQGQFSEEDDETGWNSFELRMYDAIVGRWNATDPAEQFHSSYLGMGNNPISLVDPDGAFSKAGAWWRNGFSMNGVYESGGEWGYSRGYTYTDVSDLGTFTGVAQRFIYKDGFSGNISEKAWNSPVARAYIPDFVSVGVGFDGIAMTGGATNLDFNWVLRGPEASWKPALTVTQAIGVGYSVDATLNIGRTNYLGPANNITRNMLVTSVANGDASYWGSAGIAAGGKIGVTGSYTPTEQGYGLIGAQLNIGGGLPLGPLPVNAAGGVSNTFMIYDFHR
jgi:RHS repeat-associated protein